MEKKFFEMSCNFFSFESFGVGFTVYTNKTGLENLLREKIKIILPNEFTENEREFSAHNFLIKRTEEFEYEFYKISAETEDDLIVKTDDTEYLFNIIDSTFRITVAEFAREKVFIHAGAIGYKGYGIILPGESFHGKTTLVASLIKKGAAYYSDEYAVLDEKGFLRPFHKMLSMRGIIDDFTQLELSYKEFGAVLGTEALPVGLILLTEYAPDLKNSTQTKFQYLSKGKGMLEVLANTIPIRVNAEFTLEVLNKTVSHAIIAKCKRGEADAFTDFLLKYVEENLIK